MSSGQLFVAPQNAYLQSMNQEFIVSHHYCRVSVGGQSSMTNASINPGIDPNWKDILQFNVNGDDSCHLAIYDSAEASCDMFVGECTMPLKDIYTTGYSTNTLQLTSVSGTPCGTISIAIEFVKAEDD